jgi:sugar-specific transcriptional regulator TrmB
VSPADKRRLELIRWMQGRVTHQFLTASEIVDLSGIYTGHGRYDRCFDDLKVLAKRGVVHRFSGRPATWGLAAHPDNLA